MASKKLTLFFKDTSGFGWSENFYYSGPMADPTLTANIDEIVTKRAGILTSDCKITHARLASSTKRFPTIFSLSGGTGTPGGETPPTAVSEASLLCRFSSVALGYNRPFLRGIPQRVISGDNYAPDATFTMNLNTLFAALQDGDWNVVGTLGGAPDRFAVTNIVPLSPRGYGFTLPAGSPLVPVVGQLLRMHNCKVPGYNGLKRVTAVIGGVNINVGGAAPPVADPSTSAYVTVPGSFDNLISTCAPEGISRRAPGRPFGLSVGRRRTLYSGRQ